MLAPCFFCELNERRLDFKFCGPCFSELALVSSQPLGQSLSGTPGCAKA